MELLVTLHKMENFKEITKLDIQGVIFGSEKKLVELIKKLDAEYQPKGIFILPSVVTDVINDDLTAISYNLQDEVGAKLIVIRSQTFSHMDKSNFTRVLKDSAKQKGSEANLSFAPAFLTPFILAEIIPFSKENIVSILSFSPYERENKTIPLTFSSIFLSTSFCGFRQISVQQVVRNITRFFKQFPSRIGGISKIKIILHNTPTMYYGKLKTFYSVIRLLFITETKEDSFFNSLHRSRTL